MIDKIYHQFKFVVTIFLLIGMGIVVAASTVELLLGLAEDLMNPPGVMLGLTELYDTFGFFMLVLIAVELMGSVYMYLKHESIHLEIMFLIAITAVTRKIVVMDAKAIDPMVLVGLALLIAALSWGYVYISQLPREDLKEGVTQGGE